MASNHTSEPLPEGFKNWKEFNKAKKEKKRLKQEYKIKKLEEQKQKESVKELSETVQADKVCDEPSTLSIAVPGSILDNAQSAELRTYLAGQIARAACVFKVDEIIVYDDVGIQDNIITKTVSSMSDSGEVRPARKCCAQLARILQYLECPQYLRKEFFPKHHDLDYAGLLNPLDAPHHMRQQDDGRFREGIVINQPAKNGCYVNVGLLKNVKVDRPIQPGVRVTVEMLPSPPETKRLYGRVVPPNRPLKECGIYWGYSVRLANSFNTVFTECPFKEGYDVTIGTSERGVPVENISFPSHQHVLVVFGGLSGIEAALETDDVLTVDDPVLMFDHYVNTCPDQGSRTIRTEEAILISLAELRSRLKPKVLFKPLTKEINITADDSDGSQSSNEYANSTKSDTEDVDSSAKDSKDDTSNETNAKDTSTKQCSKNSSGLKIKRKKDKEFLHGVLQESKKSKLVSTEDEVHPKHDTSADSIQLDDSDVIHSKLKKKKKRKSHGVESCDL